MDGASGPADGGTRTAVAIGDALLQCDLPELIEESAQLVAAEHFERLGDLVKVRLRVGVLAPERVPLQRQVAVPATR